MIARGYRPEFANNLLQPDQGLRRIRLPGEPRRGVRPAGLHLRLDEVRLSGRVRLRPAQQPADGLLRPGPDRPRRCRARGRGPASRGERQRLGQHPGTPPPRWGRGRGGGGRRESGERHRWRWRPLAFFTPARRPHPPPLPLPPSRGRGTQRARTALRLGLRQIDGFREAWASAIMAARAEAPFASLDDLRMRAACRRPRSTPWRRPMRSARSN
ncbi:MAG: hypothetical protein WDM92_12270 [Caulobacteraceae bacterium]